MAVAFFAGWQYSEAIGSDPDDANAYFYRRTAQQSKGDLRALADFAGKDERTASPQYRRGSLRPLTRCRDAF